MRELLTRTAGRYQLATKLVCLVAATMLFADWITGGFHPESRWIEGRTGFVDIDRPLGHARDGVWERLLVTLPICFVLFAFVLRRGDGAGGAAGSAPRSIDSESPVHSEATPEAIEPADRSTVTDASENASPIECTLPLDDDEYLEIVLDFIERMDARLMGMLSMIQRSDFENLESEAHWLKGAGGTVGFPDLTEPSRDLMNAARQSDIQRCQELIQVILEIRQRIVLPENRLQTTAGD